MEYQQKLEENMINIVNNTNKKINNISYFIFFFIGIIAFILGISYHNSIYVFPVLFELYGVFLIIYSTYKLISNKIIKSIIIIFSFIILFLTLWFFDSNLADTKAPKYYYNKKTIGSCVIYKKIFNNNIVFKNNIYYGKVNDINQISDVCK